MGKIKAACMELTMCACLFWIWAVAGLEVLDG